MDLEETSISPVIGVLLIIAITVVLSAGLVITLTDFGDIDTETTSDGIDIEKTEDGVRVSTITTSDGVATIKNSSGSTLGTLDLSKTSSKTFEYYKIVNGSTYKGEVIVTSNEKVLLSKEIDISSNKDLYYKDPNTVSKSDIKLVRDSYVVDTDGYRYHNTNEDFKVKFEGPYNPDDFEYTWTDVGEYGTKYSVVKSTDKEKATYFHKRVIECCSYGGAEVVIEKPDGSTVTRSISSKIPKAVQDVTIEGRGIKGVNLGDNYNDRYLGSEEDFAVTNVKLHSGLNGVISDDPSSSDIKYQWLDASEYGYKYSYVISSNKNESTYEHRNLVECCSYGGAEVIVWADFTGKGGSIKKELNAKVKHAIQDFTIEARGMQGIDLGGSYNERYVGSEEDFAVTNVTLASELQGVIGDDPRNTRLNYQWLDASEFGNKYSYVSSTNRNESVYEHRKQIACCSYGGAELQMYPDFTGKDGVNKKELNAKIVYAVQSISPSSKEYGTDFSSVRPLGSTENFSVDDVTLHSQISGKYDVTELNFQWFDKTNFGYTYSSVKSQTANKSEYEHVRDTGGTNNGGFDVRVYPDFTGQDGRNKFVRKFEID